MCCQLLIVRLVQNVRTCGAWLTSHLWSPRARFRAHMANRTDPLARQVHGSNPQFLVEKILRLRIYANRYWKEQCFGLTAETLIDRAAKLEFVGGSSSHNVKPTPFICLLLKLLQIQPHLDIVFEYIKQEEYKYLRALGAMYVRLAARPAEVYRYLEPLLEDYSKLAKKTPAGWELIHMDEFVDELLTSELCCDVTLPVLPKRSVLEGTGQVGPRASSLDADLEEEGARAAHAAAGRRPEQDEGEEQGDGADAMEEDGSAGVDPGRHHQQRQEMHDRSGAPPQQQPPLHAPPVQGVQHPVGKLNDDSMAGSGVSSPLHRLPPAGEKRDRSSSWGEAGRQAHTSGAGVDAKRHRPEEGRVHDDEHGRGERGRGEADLYLSRERRDVYERGGEGRGDGRGEGRGGMWEDGRGHRPQSSSTAGRYEREDGEGRGRSDRDAAPAAQAPAGGGRRRNAFGEWVDRAGRPLAGKDGGAVPAGGRSSGGGGTHASRQEEGRGGGGASEGSTEYWNEMRAKLGLKPLQ